MNLTSRLSIQDFTTLEAVKVLLGVPENECSRDEMIEALIDAISGRFVGYLGLHAVSTARVELYEVRQHKKILSLDAKPIDTGQTFEIRIASNDDFTGLSAISTETYTLHAPEGWIRFRRQMPNAPNYVQVTYTGGLGATTADLMSRFPELAHAAELQVKYLLNRRDSLGGTITSGGFGSSNTLQAVHTSPYKLLPEVEAILATHRRLSL